MSALAVVVATLISFLAGAFHWPWWIPLIAAPAAVWGYAQIVSPTHRSEAVARSRFLEPVVTQIVNLYLAFTLGWLVALLLG